jgi:hypothetical protein
LNVSLLDRAVDPIDGRQAAELHRQFFELEERHGSDRFLSVQNVNWSPRPVLPYEVLASRGSKATALPADIASLK